jgi:5-methylcytosine-specific restriction endonuclease McrA
MGRHNELGRCGAKLNAVGSLPSWQRRGGRPRAARRAAQRARADNNRLSDQSISLEKCPALVLNADYRPLSYYPLSLWSWQDSIKSVFLDRVSIVSYYDRQIRSPSFSMKLPSVIALKSYIRPQSNPNFTRFNVFLRDKFSCQYCGSKDELTFDHLLPRSKGGKTNWDNVVTACSSCNVKKGGRLIKNSGMTLNQWPFQPTTEDLHKNGKNFPPNFLHKSWMDYLYWDVELEP